MLLLQFLKELLVGQDPAEAARDVLQPQHVQVVAVHARHAVGQHDHAVIEVERGECGVEHAGVGVDAHQHYALDAQGVQQLAQVGAVEAVEPLLVVDDVIGDRKSTRLNSSHGYISYAVFCLKKKKKT